MKRCVALTFVLAAFSLAGCAGESADPTNDPACDGGKCDDAEGDESEAANVCVAMRGNGDRIFGLIAGVSRVVEHYGLLAGAAGGSSASITSFFIESVHDNPGVTECGYDKSACSPEESAARAALLLKSLQGYFEVLSRSDEALAFGTLAPLAGRIQESGVEGLLEEDPVAAQAALSDLLESQDLRDIINDEVLETIQESPDPAFHVRDFVETLSGFGAFKVEDDSVLMRPGFVDFEKVAEKLGRIGGFLAGDAPVNFGEMQEFFEHCATPGRGENWPKVAKLRAGSTTCGEKLTGMVEAYRDIVTAPGADFESRVDRPIGEGFHSIVATSVLTGKSVGAWEDARAQYRNAEAWKFEIDFEDVKLGYFANEADLAAMRSNPNGYSDAKTRKFEPLGQVTWREALKYSPAEPGIARALEIDDKRVSAGGWPDLHPVLGLKNVGCDKVVYVTRGGTESQFALRMADTALDAAPEQVAELYSLDGSTPDSGFALSLQEADAVLCTDWDQLPGLDLPVITGGVWADAVLVTDDPFFTGSENPDRKIIGVAQGKAGCAFPTAGE